MSEIIRVKTRTTRPARERLLEYMTDQPNYRKREKAEVTAITYIVPSISSLGPEKAIRKLMVSGQCQFRFHRCQVVCMYLSNQ